MNASAGSLATGNCAFLLISQFYSYILILDVNSP